MRIQSVAIMCPVCRQALTESASFRQNCSRVCLNPSMSLPDSCLLIEPVEIAVEVSVKLFKKSQNCLFVEEESYNWAAPRSSVNRKLVVLAVLFVVAALLFNAVN